MKIARWLGLAVVLLGGCTCEREPEPVASEARRAPADVAAPAQVPAGPARIPVPGRLVAIGDLHGDLDATRGALRLAGAIDGEDNWTGDKLVVVQTGDQLDRGDDEPDVLALFDALAEKAKQKGGAVISLCGNHEVMNVQGDFRYVTAEGFSDFASHAASARNPGLLSGVPAEARGRAAAFLPGGPFARRLAERPLTAIVGDNLFVHGGVLPSHVGYGLRRANEQARAWMRGELGSLPSVLNGDDAPIWTRAYADLEPAPASCDALSKVLDSLKVKRMVVGHTVQKDGIVSGCGERVWRIDVGLAKHYGGRLAVLEIRGGRVRILSAGDQ